MKASYLLLSLVSIYLVIVIVAASKYLRKEYRFSATESAYFKNYTPQLRCSAGVKKDKRVLKGESDKGHIYLYFECYYDTGSICSKPADTVELMLKNIVTGFEKIMDYRERYDSVTITLTERKIIDRRNLKVTCKKSFSYALNALQD